MTVSIMNLDPTQPGFTCSKSVMETEQCEICSKLIQKTLEQSHWCHGGIFIVNFEQIRHSVLMFLMLMLDM